MQHVHFADDQHGRRHRRPLQPVAGYPDIPVYERRADAQHGSGHAMGFGTAMGRVLHMDATGVWVILLNGDLAEIDGRCHWPARDDLFAAAKGAGIALSNLMIRTGA